LWACRASAAPPKYTTFHTILAEAARAAGVNKRVNPHNFRHSRATRLANHLTEAQMSHFFGWTQGSKMSATYVHLSGRDVDAAILESYGIKAQQQTEANKLAPRKCDQCQAENPATNT